LFRTLPTEIQFNQDVVCRFPIDHTRSNFEEFSRHTEQLYALSVVQSAFGRRLAYDKHQLSEVSGK
jgi:hypothetical protein